VERSSTTPIMTSVPNSRAAGSSSATTFRISPIDLSRSTRRRQAGALRATLEASATFDTEASRLQCPQDGAVGSIQRLLVLQFCCADVDFDETNRRHFLIRIFIVSQIDLILQPSNSRCSLRFPPSHEQGVVP